MNELRKRGGGRNSARKAKRVLAFASRKTTNSSEPNQFRRSSREEAASIPTTSFEGCDNELRWAFAPPTRLRSLFIERRRLKKGIWSTLSLSSGESNGESLPMRGTDIVTVTGTVGSCSDRVRLLDLYGSTELPGGYLNVESIPWPTGPVTVIIIIIIIIINFSVFFS